MIIRVENLRKRYKKQSVLQGIDIHVEEPAIIALVGPNGAGKTTLMNCMTNLLTFNEGKVELLGKSNKDPALFYKVAYLQDNRILYSNLNGYDHLKFVCDMQKMNVSNIERVTEKLGMQGYVKQKVKNYSLGMKQHLLLAMAIINEPELLLLDEPLNGLDPTSAINMRKVLLDLHNEGTTILISSHNLAEIDRLTDTIYFMKDGKLLQESLKDITTKRYMISVNDPDHAQDILRDAHIPFDIDKFNRLDFDEEETPLQDVLEELYDNDIAVTDVEKTKKGAEKRYQEIFEGVKTV